MAPFFFPVTYFGSRISFITELQNLFATNGLGLGQKTTAKHGQVLYATPPSPPNKIKKTRGPQVVPSVDFESSVATVCSKKLEHPHTHTPKGIVKGIPALISPTPCSNFPEFPVLRSPTQHALRCWICCATRPPPSQEKRSKHFVVLYYNFRSLAFLGLLGFLIGQLKT